MMTALRQLMNFIVSIGLIGAGLYVMYEELFVRYSSIHGRYRPIGVGLALIGCGVVWLWFYLLGPIVLKRLSREE
jgi:divalent metal cation (Fe/Co/Zn/Cd) transporter